MRPWKSRANLAGIAVLSVVLANPALASNFGSNTASGGSGAHPCDTTKQSQCVADNGSHTVYDFNLSSTWHTAVNNAIVVQYDPVTDVSASWAGSSNPDVYGTSGAYGVNGLWGWGLCSGSATYGGSDPDRWCKFRWMEFNTSYSQNATQKDAIACHELGHTLGLRHSAESSGSCMKANQRTIWVISSHDRSMLNGQY